MLIKEIKRITVLSPKEKKVLNFNHVLLYCLTTIVNLTFNYRLQISEQMTDDR